MVKIYLKDQEHFTNSSLPDLGSTIPNITLTTELLKPFPLHGLMGKPVLFNIYPSIDTEICFDSIKAFHKNITTLLDIHLVCISMDSPYALQRSTQEEDFSNITLLSDMRNRDFGSLMGLTIVSGKMAGFLARSVIVTDSNLNIVYHELVSDLSNAPNYDSAIKAIKEID